MAEFESDDQQVEAIKKWWSENGTSLIVGLVLGVAALFGWREYVSYQTEHAAEASDLFQAAQVQFASKDMTEAQTAKADTLRAEYADTPYAALVSLAQAKFDYENGKTEDALKHLRWARDNAIEDDVRHIDNARPGVDFRGTLSFDNYGTAIVRIDHALGDIHERTAYLVVRAAPRHDPLGFAPFEVYAYEAFVRVVYHERLRRCPVDVCGFPVHAELLVDRTGQ